MLILASFASACEGILEIGDGGWVIEGLNSGGGGGIEGGGTEGGGIEGGGIDGGVIECFGI